MSRRRGAVTPAPLAHRHRRNSVQRHVIPHPRACKLCGTTYVAHYPQLYCSLACSFWSRVQKSNGCWLWTGCTIKGYGTLRYAGMTYRVNRLSWALAHNPIADGLIVCHDCDNPLCVRPDHLFLGTVADNNHDMSVKGRASHGSQRPHAKLTEEEVIRLRELHRSGQGVRKLARAFGIAKTTAQQILRRRRWTHVP